MPHSRNKLSQFWEELKRRKVIRVITVYAAAAFVILEAVDIIFPRLGLPDWTVTLVIFLLAIGLIISVILSWIYDIKPEGGIIKTEPAQKVTVKEPPRPSNAWKIATYVSVVIITGLVLLHVLSRKDTRDLTLLDKTIAILPFENLGLEQSEASLNDALPIALTMELRKIEGFKVPSWRSTSKYRDTAMDIPEIGAELGVNYLVLGSVQELRDKVRVDIEFIQALSNEVIWSTTEEMEMDDIFQVQRRISEKVAISLKANLSEQQEQITENSDAYLEYLAGLKYYQADEDEYGAFEALNHFNEAVQLDPDFVQAYVKISSSHSWIYQLHYDYRPERLQMAREALDRAIEIDPDYPDIHLAEGIYHYVRHEYQEARAQLLQGIGQVDDEFDLYISLGALSRREQNLEQSASYYIKAAETEPQSRIPRLELAENSLLLREYEMAEQNYIQYDLMGGAYLPSLVNIMDVYLLWNGDTEKSREKLQELISANDNVLDPALVYYSFRIDRMDHLYDQAFNTISSAQFDALDNQFGYMPKSLYLALVSGLQQNMDLSLQYYDSARIHLEGRISLNPEDSRYYSALGMAYAGLGRTDDAVMSANESLSLMPLEKDYYRGIFRLNDAALIYTMSGKYDLALETIDQLLSIPSLLSVELLKRDPVWEPLWDLQGFTEIVQKYQVPDPNAR